MREGVTYKRLNEVCSSASSNVVINKVANDNGDYPLYGASGVVKNVSFFHRNTPYIGIIKDGAGVGRVNRYPAYSSLVGTLQYIIPNSDVCSIDYIYYVLKHMDLGHSFTGATIPHIYFKDYGKKLIPVPSLDEQQRIVSELDRLASIISDKQQQLRELDNLAQAIFYSMFGDPLTNPQGWEMKPVSNLVYDKRYIDRAAKKFSDSDIIHYIDISSIDNKSNTLIGTTDYIFKDAPSRAQQCVEYGDVLISLVRPNLKNIAIVSDNRKALVASSGFCVLRANNSSNRCFIEQVLLTDNFTEYLLKRVSGANYPAVRECDILDCKVINPPLDLQQQFAEKVQTIEEQKDVLKQSIAEFENLLVQRMEYHFA